MKCDWISDFSRWNINAIEVESECWDVFSFFWSYKCTCIKCLNKNIKRKVGHGYDAEESFVAALREKWEMIHLSRTSLAHWQYSSEITICFHGLLSHNLWSNKTKLKHFQMFISYYSRLIFSPEVSVNNIKQQESIPTGQRVKFPAERSDNTRDAMIKSGCYFSKGLKILLKQLRDWFIPSGTVEHIPSFVVNKLQSMVSHAALPRRSVVLISSVYDAGA